MRYGEMIKLFIKKQLENFSSAKMLMFFLPFFISTWCLNKIINGSFIIISKLMTISENPDIIALVPDILEICSTSFISFCTFTVSLGGTIIVCREIFKVQKLKELNNKEKEKVDI